MRSFVLLVDDESPVDDREKVVAAITEDKDVDWWHWFNYSWLVKDRKDRTASEWREVLVGVAPKAQIVILEVEPKKAAYWTQKDSADWIAESWPAND